MVVSNHRAWWFQIIALGGFKPNFSFRLVRLIIYIDTLEIIMIVSNLLVDSDSRKSNNSRHRTNTHIFVGVLYNNSVPIQVRILMYLGRCC